MSAGLRVCGMAVAAGVLSWSAAASCAAQDLDLETLRCEQVGRIAPESVQTTVIGLLVGYAMGEEGAPLDLEAANIWFAAFRDLCSQAPKAPVKEVLPLLRDSAAGASAQ